MAENDGFFDAKNNVIYNRLGITNQDELRIKEGNYSIPAMLRLVVGSNDIRGDFNAAHLKQIHKAIFQEVYGWAGETRANGPDGPFQGEKKTYVQHPWPSSGDVMRYGPYSQLDQRLDAIGAQLMQENKLRGLNPEQFAQRAAYYFDQYNHAHAFREGNGRTLQGVMAVLGREAGYQVELSEDAAARLNNVRDFAIIRPVGPEQPGKNLEPLAILLSTAIEPLLVPEAEQLRHPSQARPLVEPTPEMQRIEALRVMQASSWEVGSALRDIDKGDTTRGNQLMKAMQDVLLEQTPIAEVAPLLLSAAKEVAQHPMIAGQEPETVQHTAWLSKSVAQLVTLDQQSAPRLTLPKFDIADLPAAILQRLGNSVEQIAAQPGQLNKLLRGEKTDPIPGFSLPPRAGIAPADLGPFSMQLVLVRDATGKTELRFDLPQKQRAIITGKQQPTGPTVAPGPPKPEAPKIDPTTSKDVKPSAKPAVKPDTPKPKGRKPRH